MVMAISYVIAVCITIAIACILYPIAALFWVFGLLGRISDVLFAFTTNVIRNLWKDLKGNNDNAPIDEN